MEIVYFINGKNDIIYSDGKTMRLDDSVINLKKRKKLIK